MASPHPLVSIVVPCYLRTDHEAALLDETLSSIDAQTWAAFEVIVVDDGSPVPAASIASRHARTTVIRQENAGAAMARNTGIERIRGEFVVFLDADDHLLPPALAAGVRQLEAHPECAFAIGPREEMTYEGAPVPWGVPVPPPGGDVYKGLLGFDWYIIPPSSAMFRREVVREVGGFRDPWGADDLDFYLRVARRGAACCYQSPAVTRYRRYSTSSSRDGARMLTSIRTVYAREWSHVAGNPELEAAFRKGLSQLTEIFLDCVVENVQDGVRTRQWRRAARSAALLAKESPRRLLKLGTRPG